MKHIHTEMKTLLIATFIFISTFATAQNDAPASGKPLRILFWNGTAHLGNGDVIPASAVGMADGKITMVTSNAGLRPDLSLYDTLIDLTGKHIYPGLIALNTQIGLREIELVRSTNDYRETGNVNPSSRAIIAYNTDSRVTPTVRSNGVLLAQIVPEGRMVSGTSSVVELDGWNWEDAVYKIDDGIHLNWPGMRIYRSRYADSEEEQKKRIAESMEEITRLFNDARAYHSVKNPRDINVHLEAMGGLFDGTKKLFVTAGFARDIIAAVNFCNSYGIKMVLVGGQDSWRVAGFLKENNIPVVITRTHLLPYREDDDTDLPYKLPFLLKQAGVNFCITDEGFWQQRNLPFQAGTAAAYGLTKAEALQSITLSAAQILGIDKSAGSLEPGKDATLVISSGDILDMMTNNIEKAYIRGREINLNNTQTILYEKYRKKYGFDKEN